MPPSRIAGVADCHCHVFEDPRRFPLRVAASYEPPISPLHALRDMARRAGIGRFVLVQPMPYGDDLGLLQASLDELNASAAVARGVGVAGETVTESALARMHAAGIVALRFVDMRQSDGSALPGAVPPEVLFRRLAPQLQAAGLHAELWAPLARTLARRRRLESLGIPLVLDHMGGFEAGLGVQHGDFRNLLALLREGRVWVKLAVCRRTVGRDHEALRPFHDALVEANSHQLLWASDFPFVRHPGVPPEVGDLLGLVHRWVADPVIAARILVENPQRLYRF